VVVGDCGMAVFDDSLPWSAKLQIYKHKIIGLMVYRNHLKPMLKSINIEESEPLS